MHGPCALGPVHGLRRPPGCGASNVALLCVDRPGAGGRDGVLRPQRLPGGRGRDARGSGVRLEDVCDCPAITALGGARSRAAADGGARHLRRLFVAVDPVGQPLRRLAIRSSATGLVCEGLADGAGQPPFPADAPRPGLRHQHAVVEPGERVLVLPLVPARRVCCRRAGWQGFVAHRRRHGGHRHRLAPAGIFRDRIAGVARRSSPRAIASQGLPRWRASPPSRCWACSR